MRWIDCGHQTAEPVQGLLVKPRGFKRANYELRPAAARPEHTKEVLTQVAADCEYALGWAAATCRRLHWPRFKINGDRHFISDGRGEAVGGHVKAGLSTKQARADSEPATRRRARPRVYW